MSDKADDLPEPDCIGVHFDGHSSDQMHAYAAAAVAKERERIAAFVEGPCGDMQLADRNELRAVAAAIRDVHVS